MFLVACFFTVHEHYFCGIFRLYREYGKNPGLLRISEQDYHRQGGLYRRYRKPGHQQCAGGTAFVRIYRKLRKPDSRDKPGRPGNADRIHGKPDLLQICGGKGERTQGRICQDLYPWKYLLSGSASYTGRLSDLKYVDAVIASGYQKG